MIFFDIDNTLIDFEYSEIRAVKKMFHDLFNITLTSNQIKYWQDIANLYYRRYLNGEMTYDTQAEETISAMLIYLDIGSRDVNISNLFQYYCQQRFDHWIVFDDVRETLEKLKDKRLGIISNGNYQQQKNKLTCTRIDDFFEVKVFSEEIGKAKPSHDIFLHAIKLSGEDIKEIVYIGDDFETDITPCKELGIKCFLIDRNNSIPDNENVLFSLLDLCEKI